MNNQKGIALTIILIIVALLITGGALFMAGFNPFNKPAPSPTAETITEDYRERQKDPNDSRYDLVKKIYNLDESQVKVLTRVSDEE